MDLRFASETGARLAEELYDFVGLEVEPFDGVIGPTALDGGPIDDGRGGGATRVAEIGLLIDFVSSGTGLAIGKELGGREAGALAAIDDIDEAEVDGIGHRDSVVEVPGAVGIFDFRFLTFDWFAVTGVRGEFGALETERGETPF